MEVLMGVTAGAWEGGRGGRANDGPVGCLSVCRR